MCIRDRLGPDDEPLRGVMVSAGMSGARPVNGRTDENGTCELTVDSRRPVQLGAWGRGSLPADLVPPPTQTLGPDETTATCPLYTPGPPHREARGRPRGPPVIHKRIGCRQPAACIG